MGLSTVVFEIKISIGTYKHNVVVVIKIDAYICGMPSMLTLYFLSQEACLARTAIVSARSNQPQHRSLSVSHTGKEGSGNSQGVSVCYVVITA